MCMPPNAIYRTCWFTHRSGLEFHGRGPSHCFPSAISAARAQVLIKPKTTLHASVIFSKGCKDRTRSATAALEHPKTRTPRRWLAKSVLIMLEYRFKVWRKVLKVLDLLTLLYFSNEALLNAYRCLPIPWELATFTQTVWGINMI